MLNVKKTRANRNDSKKQNEESKEAGHGAHESIEEENSPLRDASKAKGGKQSGVSSGANMHGSHPSSPRKVPVGESGSRLLEQSSQGKSARGQALAVENQNDIDGDAEDEDLAFLFADRVEYPRIEQAATTVFRVRPQDWNNVPRIVYDAICILVNSFDRLNLESMRQFSDTGSALGLLRTRLDGFELTLNEMKASTREEFKKTQDLSLERIAAAKADTSRKLASMKSDLDGSFLRF